MGPMDVGLGTLWTSAHLSFAGTGCSPVVCGAGSS